MKLAPFLLVSVAALAAPAIVSAANFEGSVRMKMSGPRGHAQELTFHFKDGRQRTDIETEHGKTMSAIIDPAKQEMLLLMPEQKMYMVQSLQPVTDAAEKMSQPSDATFEKTGETEKILGYTCTKYVSNSKGVTTDIWATDELGRFMGLARGGGPMGGRSAEASRPAWERELMNKDFFPLRVVSHNEKGEQFRMEATAVDQSSQPDSLFEPPADFRKFDLGGMMRGLGFPGKR